MRGAVIVRLFADGDQAGLYALAPPHHAALVDRAIARHLAGDNVVLVAASDRAIVGQVWLDVERRRGEGVATLWALRVAAAEQHRGIGGMLVDAAERVTSELGFGRIALGVADGEDDHLVAMYERRGYHVVGRRVDREQWRTSDGRFYCATFAQLSLEKELLHVELGHSLDHR